jgi:hypothetical protein
MRSGPWILLACAANTIVTTIHHLHGARIYETPERYEAVWIALVGLGVSSLLLTLGLRPGRLGQAARGSFMVVTALLFVVTFGIVEGFGTHIVYPLLQGGYGAAEPFDTLFQVTGVLHVVPAAAVALLLVAYRREGRLVSSPQTPRPSATTLH